MTASTHPAREWYVRHRGVGESYVTAGKFKMNNKDKHYRFDSIPKEF